jgi:hypothetical protein
MTNDLELIRTLKDALSLVNRRAMSANCLLNDDLKTTIEALTAADARLSQADQFEEMHGMGDARGLSDAELLFIARSMPTSDAEVIARCWQSANAFARRAIEATDLKLKGG